jgi:hypothetical protein
MTRRALTKSICAFRPRRRIEDVRPFGSNEVELTHMEVEEASI